MADETEAQSPDQPAQEDEEEYLKTGKIPRKEHIKALNCHQEMHYYLIYARRQILVVFQLFFGCFRPYQLMARQDYVTPINDQGHQLDIFYSERLTDYDWHCGLTKGWDHIRRRIADDLNIEQNQVANLPPRQLHAKYLEVAVTGLDNIVERIAERMQLIDSYINKCRKLVLLLEEGQNRDIKKATVDIWVDKLNQLTAQVKSVTSWRNQLLKFAATLINEPTTEIDRNEVGRILGRIYDRLYSAPNRVPIVDFANVSWKISGWNFSGRPKDESGNIIWFSSTTHIVNILGELGVLARRLEAIERGEDTDLVPRAPKWIEPIDTKFELNSNAFHCLQDFYKELIWGRRQILIVFQLIFGDFVPNRDINQQLFVGPYEDDGSKFNIEQREGIDSQKWGDAVQFALNYVTNAINYEQHTNPDSITSDEQRNAKYLELAAEGLKHIVQLTSEKLGKFKDYVAECEKVLKKGPDRKNKQEKVNKFSQKFLVCSAQLKQLIELQEKLLEMADNLLDEPWTSNFEMLRNNLGGVYFFLYPIPDQLPMKEFVDVAYGIFGWNWTIELLPDHKSGQFKYLDTPFQDVQIRGSFGILTERRNQKKIEDQEEAGGLSQVGVEPPGVEAPEEIPKIHYNVFCYLQKMNNKLIYARRTILVVIKMFFRKINPQQGYTWPIRDDGEQFELGDEEDLDPNDWNKNGIKVGGKIIYNMIRNEQDKPSKMPASELTNEYKEMAKYLEVAVVGLDYLVEQISEWNEMFNRYLPHCQAEIRALEVRSPERKMKQAALDTLVERINELATHIREVRDQYKDRLLEMAEQLFEQSVVDSNEVHDALSRVYFQLHQLAEQVPINEFVNVAALIFGCNFNNYQRINRWGQVTYFETPRHIVNTLGDLGVLWDRIKTRRAQGGGGAQS